MGHHGKGPFVPNDETWITRPEDVLPAGVEHVTLGGVALRKGTVAAFVQNARRWLDPHTPENERDALTGEMVRAGPALRAVGVLDIFAIRDARLAALIEQD